MFQFFEDKNKAAIDRQDFFLFNLIKFILTLFIYSFSIQLFPSDLSYSFYWQNSISFSSPFFSESLQSFTPYKFVYSGSYFLISYYSQFNLVNNVKLNGANK